MPKPRTLREAWAEMRETWERQKEYPHHYFDTPLPEIANQVRPQNTDELESSIGELAPKGLE